MDGPLPLRELSDAGTLGRVLAFREANVGEEVFAVDEVLDCTGISLTTVVRPRTEDDV